MIMNSPKPLYYKATVQVTKNLTNNGLDKTYGFLSKISGRWAMTSMALYTTTDFILFFCTWLTSQSLSVSIQVLSNRTEEGAERPECAYVLTLSKAIQKLPILTTLRWIQI